MRKIKEKKGQWKDAVVITDLYWEDCTNPKCPNEEMHYPTYLVNPHCPDCQHILDGGELFQNQEDRIEFHLEA
jgi:hypothetical protein